MSAKSSITMPTAPSEVITTFRDNLTELLNKPMKTSVKIKCLNGIKQQLTELVYQHQKAGI